MRDSIASTEQSPSTVALRRQSQISLTELLATFALAAGVMSLVPYVGYFVAMVLGAMICLCIATYMNRWYWFALAAIPFVIYSSVLGFSIFEVGRCSPYVQRYNHRLEAQARQAQLVGAPEEMVEKTLGKATYVYSSWSPRHIDTGEPAPDAKFRTTYNYAPYPMFPFQKFQVHCEGGIVRSTEMFDD